MPLNRHVHKLSDSTFTMLSPYLILPFSVGTTWHISDICLQKEWSYGSVKLSSAFKPFHPFPTSIPVIFLLAIFCFDGLSLQILTCFLLNKPQALCFFFRWVVFYDIKFTVMEEFWTDNVSCSRFILRLIVKEAVLVRPEDFLPVVFANVI